MTHDYGAPPDVENVVVAWLSALGDASTQRPAGDNLPFFMVTRVGGGDDKIWDYATIDVDSFDVDQNSANIAARQAHHRMLSVLPDDEITLPDGSKTHIDQVNTVQGPIYVTWGLDQVKLGTVNTIVRYVARYNVDLRFEQNGGS